MKELNNESFGVHIIETPELVDLRVSIDHFEIEDYRAKHPGYAHKRADAIIKDILENYFICIEVESL